MRHQISRNTLCCPSNIAACADTVGVVVTFYADTFLPPPPPPPPWNSTCGSRLYLLAFDGAEQFIVDAVGHGWGVGDCVMCHSLQQMPFRVIGGHKAPVCILQWSASRTANEATSATGTEAYYNLDDER